MKRYTPDELKTILALHLKWVLGEKDGVRANLSGSDLSGSDLSGSDLSGSDLSGANLREANLRWANLRGADLREANLSGVNLSGANLSGSDLSGANLREANLRGAYLNEAYLSDGIDIISVSGIGSARRMTTYWVQADKVWCGCFTGTLAEFEAKVEKTHADNPKHLANYRAAIALFKTVKEGK